jgi:UDP-glucose 4-epimerase
MSSPNHEIKIIGTRHGEKLYESLLSREEHISAEDMGNYFRIPPDLRDLNYGKYVEYGEAKISVAEDYNSHNAYQLDVDEVFTLLSKLPFMQGIISDNCTSIEE